MVIAHSANKQDSSANQIKASLCRHSNPIPNNKDIECLLLQFYYFISDLRKLYGSTHLDPDKGPKQLQAKVMFDIWYFFCRRGGENIHDFDIGTFELQYDTSTGISYVKKVKDEMTKNHHEKDSELITGAMPEMKNPDGTFAKMCPVRSFTNYINALDKKADFLWQKPKNKIPKSSLPWYIAQQVGHNTHEKFMGKLSEKAQLSQHYTNHCIRVSGITNLTKANFTSKQVMAVSSHKSVESLAIYQRVHEDEKLMMGLCLNYCLTQDFSPRKEIQPVQIPQVEAPPKNEVVISESAVVPYSAQNTKDQPNFDILELLSETIDEVNDEELVMAATQCENALMPQKTSVITNTSTVMRKSTPNTTFSNCSFGNITNFNIHIHKN